MKKHYEEEEEEEEEDENNNYNTISNNANNKIINNNNNIYKNNYNNIYNKNHNNNFVKRNQTYFVPNNNLNNNFNNINKYYSNDINFSPKKTNLSRQTSQPISRNPNYFNYAKNKKVFIPLNIMNLVSFINSQTNENINSIPVLDILTKIKSLNNPLTQNNQLKKSKNQIFFDNKNTENLDILKRYKENYNQMKNEEILAKSAFDIEPSSPINKKNSNDFNKFSLPYNNKYNITENNFKNLNNFNNKNNAFISNNNNTFNKSNSGQKMIVFNNTLRKTNSKKINMKNNMNNHY